MIQPVTDTQLRVDIREERSRDIDRRHRLRIVEEILVRVCHRSVVADRIQRIQDDARCPKDANEFIRSGSSWPELGRSLTQALNS